MRALVLPLLSLLTAPVAAEPMSPAEFEKFAEGRTLHFTQSGQPFGSERYFAGRRSLWQASDGQCETGGWHADGGTLCFVYEDDPGPHCWRLEREGHGLTAILVEDGQEAGLRLTLERVDDAPLDCPGPDVGS